MSHAHMEPRNIGYRFRLTEKRMWVNTIFPNTLEYVTYMEISRQTNNTFDYQS